MEGGRSAEIQPSLGGSKPAFEQPTLTFFRTIGKILGPHAGTISSSVLVCGDSGKSGNAGVLSDIARLADMRFCVANESGKSDTLDDSILKKITSIDAFDAKKMRQDMATLQPRHHLHHPCNGVPQILATDDGTWRRIMLVRWDLRVTTPDLDLDKKLADESEGILAWMVAGLMDYRCRMEEAERARLAGQPSEHRLPGLAPPKKVRDAVAALRSASDRIGLFLSECCWVADALSNQDALKASSHYSPTNGLYAKYAEWTKGQGYRPESNAKFSSHLSERGFEKRRFRGNAGNVDYWLGVVSDNLDTLVASAIGEVPDSTVKEALQKELESQSEPTTDFLRGLGRRAKDATRAATAN